GGGGGGGAWGGGGGGGGGGAGGSRASGCTPERPPARRNPPAWAPAAPPAPPAGPTPKASHNSTAAPAHLIPRSTSGLPRMTLPRPKATTNIMRAIPSATPNRHGRPRSTPTWAPVAVSSTLLGPGVPAAATENSKKAMACSA